MDRYKIIMWKTKRVVLSIVLFMLFLCTEAVMVKADEDIDKDASCSILINIPYAFHDELKDETVPVKLYRIANIAKTGSCEDLKGYEALKLSQLTSESTASEMEEKAMQVADFLRVDEGNGDKVAKPYMSFDIKGNYGEASGIEPGLYLLYVRSFESGGSKYDALPYIIFLPGSFEWQDIHGKRIKEWSYNLIGDLKLGYETPELDKVPPEKTEGEKTGDTTNVQLLYVSAIFFGLVFILVGFLRKRNKVTD